MKTKLFLFLGLVSGQIVSGPVGASSVISAHRCISEGQVSLDSCSKGPTRAQAERMCPMEFDGPVGKMLRSYDDFLECVARKTTEFKDSCVTKFEKVVLVCIESFEVNDIASEEAQKVIDHTPPLPGPGDAEVKDTAKRALAMHEREKTETQKMLQIVTDSQDQIEKDNKKLIAELEKLRPPKPVDPTPNPKPSPVEGGKEPIAEEKGKQTSPWQDLANAIMGPGTTPVSSVPVAQPTNLDQRLPRYQTVESGSSIATKAGSEPKGSAAQFSSSLSGSALNESLDQAEKTTSQTGQLEGKASGISGKVESNGSSLKAAAQKNTQGSGVVGVASTIVSEGYLSGQTGRGFTNTQGLTAAQLRARFGLGASKVSGKSQKPLTVAQLRQKILAMQQLRSPARLRTEAGIGSPHGNMFNSIKFRYEKLSSTLRP